jgi:hypothetical protein
MYMLKPAKSQEADIEKAYLHIDRFTRGLHINGGLDGNFSVRKLFHGPLD